MAVIQYTALVNQIRGKLNGSVMNKARTVNTVQKKQVQPKGQRGYQSEIRQDFSYAQRTWKDLTPLQQQSWQTAASFNPTRDRFGNQVVLSGYNQFIKASVLASYAISPFSYNAYPAAAPTKSFEIHSFLGTAFYETSLGGVGFTTYINDYSLDIDNGYGFIFDISLPISSGVTSYHGRWVNVAGSRANDSIITDLDVDLGVYYPMPISGQRILYRARLIHIQTGAVVVDLQGVLSDWMRLPVVESFTVEPSTGAPPYVFKATISNKESFGVESYGLRSLYGDGFGECLPHDGLDIPFQAIADSILLSGTWTYSSAIATGLCFGVKLQIIRAADSKVVQEISTYVDNV